MFHFFDSRSKTACRGFEPFCPCQKYRYALWVYRYFFGLDGTARQARRAEYPLRVKRAADIHSIFATVYPIGCTRSFSREVRRAGQRLRALAVRGGASRRWRSGRNGASVSEHRPFRAPQAGACERRPRRMPGSPDQRTHHLDELLFQQELVADRKYIKPDPVDAEAGRII